MLDRARATQIGSRAVVLQCWCAALVIGSLMATASPALVRYDEGRREIGGVLLLQDAQDPSVYYYLPPAPRLAQKRDGSFELLCLKYVDPSGKASGGLFHALVELTLPAEEVATLEARLQKEVAGARIAGAVPLIASSNEDSGDDEGGGSFRLVSAVLADRAEGGLTRSVVTSQRAPVTPGSRAVVAAVLDQHGATLLWDSLTSATSDVSVEIDAAYEALVSSYHARVSAEVETVYRHLSEVSNRQEEYTKRQIRNAVDQLVQDGGIQVEVTDRSNGAGGSDLEGLLDVVTQKLTETFFDHQTGWSSEPQREAIVEPDQLPGRQKRGFFSRVFRGAKDTPYFTDDQWVLKDRKEIRRHRFTLDLSHRSTLRVPVVTAGNLGGLYAALGDDPRYFRVVSFDDPDFELRPIQLQVDSAYVEAFGDTLSLVTVDLRKQLANGSFWSRTLTFAADQLAEGATVRQVELPRLGAKGADWVRYQMRVRWALRGGAVLTDPPAGDDFRQASSAVLALAPPLERRELEVDLDRSALERAGFASATVELATFLDGKPDFRRRLVLRPDDIETTATTTLFGDRGRPFAYRVSWHGAGGTVRGELQELDSGYLYLVPPTQHEQGLGDRRFGANEP